MRSLSALRTKHSQEHTQSHTHKKPCSVAQNTNEATETVPTNAIQIKRDTHVLIGNTKMKLMVTRVRTTFSKLFRNFATILRGI